MSRKRACILKIESLRITAPALGLPGYGETEILGAVTWLWMHSPKHRELPLIALSQALLAPLKAQQFILASAAHSGKGFRPVAYVGWANFNAEAESHYLQVGASALLRAEEWHSGDRMWITDWITPFGNAPQFRRIVQAQLADSCFRALYHRGDERGQRVMTMRGDRVSPSVAAAWWQARPLHTMSSAPVQ
jgi:cytolysin-activating lysine-acyltransferase